MPDEKLEGFQGRKSSKIKVEIFKAEESINEGLLFKGSTPHVSPLKKAKAKLHTCFARGNSETCMACCLPPLRNLLHLLHLWEPTKLISPMLLAKPVRHVFHQCQWRNTSSMLCQLLSRQCQWRLTCIASMHDRMHEKRDSLRKYFQKRSYFVNSL